MTPPPVPPETTSAPDPRPRGTRLLLDALSGRYDRWHWSPGLTPKVVGAALGLPLAPGPTRLAGRELRSAVAVVAGQPYAVRLYWEPGGELALVELSQPPAVPSWPAVIEALGEPDVVHPHGSGAIPGSEQRCHFDRGLTVFDGARLGYQAVWLYPPMTEQEYTARTAAFDTPTRPR